MRTTLLFSLAIAMSGTAAAQPPMAGAPPVYVFFDWGKAEVTRDGALTLDRLADDYRPGTTLALTGFSDRSGPAGVNRRTSLVRAEAVRDYLVRKGVPASMIRTHGAGESGFIISTADGVREVQNRRVEIRVDAR